MKKAEYRGLEGLVSLMERLRSEGGCPWDREQTLESLRPFIIEEAYEVVSAIDSGDLEGVKDELGDLLFQVVFACRVLEEGGHGGLEEVAGLCIEKMIRRHPHVFGTESADTPSEVLRRWEEIKEGERRPEGEGAAGAGGRQGSLHDLPPALPALMRAQKVSKRAARMGFDWPGIEDVLGKVREELEELEEAVEGGDRGAVEDELGDLLFTLVNAARFLELSPEEALRKTVSRFVQRFHYVEERAALRGGMEALDMEGLEALWEEAKEEERQKSQKNKAF